MFTVHHFWLLMILSCSTFNVLLAAWLWKCLPNQAVTLFPSLWPFRWHGFSDRYSSDSSGRSGRGKTHWADSVVGGMVMQYMNNMMGQCSVLLCHVVSFSKNFPTFFDISLEIILAACIAINSWQGSLKTTNSASDPPYPPFRLKRCQILWIWMKKARIEVFFRSSFLLIQTVEKLKALEVFLW